MGAYLSKPITEKISSDEKNEVLDYGASSMQGWRVDQEDAHNAVLSFDKGRSLFAVYDGHGGPEVAAYAASQLPEFIKKSDTYAKEQFSQALIDAFLEFDATLIEPEITVILKEIAGTKDNDDSDYDGEEVSHLCREAEMPLEEVMAKYSDNSSQFRSPNVSFQKKSESESTRSDSSSSNKEELSESFEELVESSSSKNTVSNNVENISNTAVKEETKSESQMLVNSDSNCETPESKQSNGVSDDSDDKNKSGIVNGHFSKINGKVSDEGGELNSLEDSENKNESINNKNESEIESKSITEKSEVENDSISESVTENNKSVNGGHSEPQSGKNKGTGKSLKGKSLLNNAIVQAIKVARNNEKRRKAAEKAEQIYKQIQGGDHDDVQSEDEDSDDDDDDSYENVDDDHECEDPSSDEDCNDEDEEEEEEEEEEDDDKEMEGEENVYQEFSTNMMSESGYDSGCTACVAFLNGNELYVANVGDSRCLVCRDGKAFDMSIDHKPEDEIESNRITKAGGRITEDGRVNGGLNLSRALGDHSYKQNKNQRPEDQMISPLPDVRSLTLTKEDTFMVIACDGIWNSMSSQEVCDFVSKRIDSQTKLSKIAEEMFDHCLSPDASGDGTGCDNMTCIIIKFIDFPISAKRTCDLSASEIDTDPQEKKSKIESE